MISSRNGTKREKEAVVSHKHRKRLCCCFSDILLSSRHSPGSLVAGPVKHRTLGFRSGGLGVVRSHRAWAPQGLRLSPPPSPASTTFRAAVPLTIPKYFLVLRSRAIPQGIPREAAGGLTAKAITRYGTYNKKYMK